MKSTSSFLPQRKYEKQKQNYPQKFLAAYSVINIELLNKNVASEKDFIFNILYY